LGNSLANFIQSSPGAIESLEQHGFFFRKVEGAGGTVQNVLLSNHGEINIGMSDGLKYVLRFGSVAGRERANPSSEQKSDEEKEAAGAEVSSAEEESTAGRALRNLMVMTQFDESLLTAPEYAEVPPEQPPQEKSPDDAAETATEAADAQQAAEGDGQVEEKVAEETAQRSDDEEQWRQKREAVLAENARKKKAYEDQIDAGKERSAELNHRFADWYYVISDATYQKIHLTMKDLIEQKPPTESPEGEPGLPQAGQDPLDQLRNIVPPRGN
jgi:hypothetical protein